MKTKAYQWIIFLSVLVGIVQPVHATEPWKQVMHKNGVDAYVRPVEGSKVLEVRAVTVVPARMEVVTAVMRDVENHPQWRPKCSQARVLSQPGPYSMMVYDVTNCPWPLADRDVVLECSVVVETQAARGVGHLKVVEDPETPPVKGRVRVSEMDAKYILQYLGEKKTGVVFTARVNPGGNIPTFLVNFFNKYYCYYQLQALKNQVHKEKYILQARESPDREIINLVMSDPEKRKQVFATRLGEFIQETEFIDMLVKDDQVFDRVFQGGRDSGGIGEILLYGWGSRECQEEAVAQLIRLGAPAWTDDPEQGEILATNPDLIQRILTGEGPLKGSLSDHIKNGTAARPLSSKTL